MTVWKIAGIIALAAMLIMGLELAACMPRPGTPSSPSSSPVISAPNNISANKTPQVTVTSSADKLAGLKKIQHFVFIMQEDRSFDSYFGTFPGEADGIPTGVSFINPYDSTTVIPYHDTDLTNHGGPHGWDNAQADINAGKMDGFLNQAYQIFAESGKAIIPFDISSQNPKEVLGYHDYHEISNYWNYAMLYVLQDRMFESTPSSSLSSQLRRLAAENSTIPIETSDKPSTYNFVEMDLVLSSGKIDWKCYITSEKSMDAKAKPAASLRTGKRDDDNDDDDIRVKPNPTPSPGQASTPISHVQDTAQFFLDAKSGKLPQVSWIIPSDEVSEEPPASVEAGMAYVTGLINAIMMSPNWSSTAIFLSWDDWGGFYDHMAPPSGDEFNNSIRVPGIVISPYARQNYVDHGIYSFESWLKILEDRFDVHPAGMGSTQAGDMLDGFDFNQKPRLPLTFDPNGSVFPQPLQHPEL